MTGFAAYADSGGTQNTTTLSVDVPAAARAGDVAALFLDRWSGSSTFGTPTSPEGAVARSTVAAPQGDTGSAIEARAYLLRLDGSESTLTLSWSGADWSSLGVMFFTGVDPNLDLAAVPVDTAVGSGATVPAVSVTAATGSALAYDLNTSAEGDFGAITHTPPTGYTETYEYTFNAGAYAVASSDGTQTASGASLSADHGLPSIATLVALAPESTTPPQTGSGKITLTAAATGSAGGFRSGAASVQLPTAVGLDRSSTREAGATATLTVEARLGASGVATIPGSGAGIVALAADAGLAASGFHRSGGTIHLGAVGDLNTGTTASAHDWHGVLAATVTRSVYAASIARATYRASGVPAYAAAASQPAYAATTDRT